MKNKKLMFVVGLIFTPILFCVYFIDRFFSSPLFWLNSYPLKQWLKIDQQIGNSFVRVLFIGFVGFVVWLISLI